MSGVPKESVLGPLFLNIFINDLDSGTECTLNKFENDTKLSGTVNMEEGKDAIQMDMDKFEKWAHENLTKISKVKCHTGSWQSQISPSPLK